MKELFIISLDFRDDLKSDIRGLFEYQLVQFQ